MRFLNLTQRRTLFLLVALGGCQRATVSSNSSTGVGDDTTSSSTTTPVSSSSSEESGDEADSTAGVFIPEPDGWAGMECDVWAQDCEPGFKCMPWANDGGSSWNAVTCSPLDPNPKGVGEPCTVEGSGVSGVDDCDAASMCWDVDPETNVGECVPFCLGSELNPLCEDPCRTCLIPSDGVLILCLSTCDPVEPDCPQGQGCYPISDAFMCVPDASGPDWGLYKDACEFSNACDAGLFCASADLVPDCAGANCCAPVCDLAQPVCPDANLGVECLPWFEDGENPSGCFSSTIGICGLPQP